MAEYGAPPYPQLTYCQRCCLPETTEGITFDELGICQACQSSEQKIHINWVEREKQLREILDSARDRAGSNYDCIVPISGGKDSMFQLHVLVKVYGMKPLAVTFSHNWYSETGRYNLENALEQFGVDHIMFTPSRTVINKLARKSLFAIGDACWHCHAGVGAFPLQIAVRFNIPLLIWGESIAEESGRASYFDPVLNFDRDYFTKVSAKVYPEYMVGGDITAKDLKGFELPSVEDMERVGVVGIHLGDFIFWDAERQMEFVRDTYGWREDKVEGTYKRYKSVECIMAGVHDYAKFIKRGFGRATDHVSVDVRAGLMTRQEGMELARTVDAERPEALDYYLKITGLSEEEFIEALKAHRTGTMETLPQMYQLGPKPAKPTIRPAVVDRIERISGRELNASGAADAAVGVAPVEGAAD
jgi:N-acetyl sugar amidotransferase